MLSTRACGRSLASRVRALFRNSEVGVWYDPSDLSSMWQDSAGTTASVVGQPVGLVLDKSKGLVIGSELAANGTFTTDLTGWTSTGGITSSQVDGVMRITAGGTSGGRYQDITVTTHQFVRVTARIRKVSGTSGTNVIVYAHGGFTTTLGTLPITSGAWTNYTFNVSKSGAGIRVYFQALAGDAVIEVDDVSVKEIQGNHATQSTSTARPTLQVDSGGRNYLSFDGIDDFLVTSAINFTGTDKMSVFAGVRKLSDTAVGMIIELSGSWVTNAGSFFIYNGTPAGAGSAWSTASRGTTAAGAGQVGTINVTAAPLTNVVSSSLNIAGDSSAIRANTVNGTYGIGDQGTGNFGNYPLYIGMRAGASLPFNGRLYSLIVRGAASSATDIATTEAYVNSKTGAY